MFKTSYNEEFKWPEATGWGIKKWPRDRNIEIEVMERSKPVFRNNETFLQLTDECRTPFNYLLQPKPIIQTNPSEPFCLLELPKDDGSARLTRPRVYKCPEISLDDIEDPDVREKIIDFTYSTTWGLASKDAATRVTKREVKNSVWEPPDHVLFNSNEETDEICGNITDKQMNEWDRQQSRAPGDPNMAFWQHFRNETPLKINDKDIADIKSPEFTNKILCLDKQRKLRLPYWVKPGNYAGFMPDFPMEIKPEKKKTELSDPMLTTYQISNRWWEE